MKHIVCSGCSFTRQYKRLGINGTPLDFMEDSIPMWRWPHHIQDIYKDYKVYNLGSPTNDNQVIAFSVMNQVSNLLKSGIDSNDIFVIVQWSDANRKSFFISENISNIYDSKLKYQDTHEDAYAHVSSYLDGCDKKIGKNGYYIQSGGYSYRHVLYKVVDVFDKVGEYLSPEESSISHLKNLILLQNFLDINKIKNFSFNLSFNFSQHHADLTFKDIYLKKIIPKGVFNFKYDNPYVQSLFELYDLKNMWLYKDNFTNCGGITEWAIRNFDYENDKQLFMEHDLLELSLEDFLKTRNIDEHPYGHVSQQMNKKFVKEILSNFLEN